MVGGNSPQGSRDRIISWFRWVSIATVSLSLGSTDGRRYLIAAFVGHSPHYPFPQLLHVVLCPSLGSGASSIYDPSATFSSMCGSPCPAPTPKWCLSISVSAPIPLFPLATVKHLFLLCLCFSYLLLVSGFLLRYWRRHTALYSLNIDRCLLLHNTKGLLTLLKK